MSRSPSSSCLISPSPKDSSPVASPSTRFSLDQRLSPSVSMRSMAAWSTSRHLHGIGQRRREFIAIAVTVDRRTGRCASAAAQRSPGVVGGWRIPLFLQRSRRRGTSLTAQRSLPIPTLTIRSFRAPSVFPLTEIPIRQRCPLGPGRVGHAFSTDRRLWVAAKWGGNTGRRARVTFSPNQ